MTNQDTTLVSELIGRTVVDVNGDKIGTVDDVYLEDVNGQPDWLAVSTGWFGSNVSFVPIEGASYTGDNVVVPYTKDQVKDAPNCDADGHLSVEEEQSLYAHYGRAYSGSAATDMTTTTPDMTAEGLEGTRRTAGYDTSGPNTDDAMTRSEEELRVDKRTREAGRARLSKWIETEHVQMTVPVRREKARLVTEPITDANVDQALSGPDLTESEHEVTLSEEVVDVDKRVVPKERVRLETEEVVDEVPVNETVRKERIGYEGDDDATTRGRR